MPTEVAGVTVVVAVVVAVTVVIESPAVDAMQDDEFREFFGGTKAFVCFNNERSLQRAVISGKSRIFDFSRNNAISISLAAAAAATDVTDGEVTVLPADVAAVVDFVAAVAAAFKAALLAAATEACRCERILLLPPPTPRLKAESGFGRSPAHWAPLDVLVM